jgi:hypothetical protein
MSGVRRRSECLLIAPLRERARDLRACLRERFTRKASQMFGPAAAYVVAIAAILSSGISALTLIYTVNRFDPPEVRSLPEHAPEKLVA